VVLVLAPVLAAFGLFSGSGAAQADVPPPPSGWSTVFSDDFTGAAGSGLNTSDWLYDTGTGYSGGAANWGTGEVETATNSTANVYQDGAGHLVIKPIRDSSGAWTSGRIETQRTDFAAPAGGELELSASIEQPDPATGVGYWPAFWALGADARATAATDWPAVGELDIMEDVNGLSEHSASLHCGTDPGGPCNETTGLTTGLQSCSACQTGYHTYSVILDRTNTSAEQLRYYLDGTLDFTIDESTVGTSAWQAAVDHGFFAIFDVAMGGAYPNAICGCTSPSSATTSGAGMSVDWFAAYEKS
jgi:beta-glucanase (GH16 family)